MSIPVLDPLLIALFPRWSDAVPVVSEMRVDHAVALAESESQVQCFREQWSGRDDLPLLILRGPTDSSLSLSVDAVLEISSHSPGRPVSVLLADGPEVNGFRAGRRKDWNRKFAKALAEGLLDVQVFEYAATWATHPPRIR